MQFVRDEAGVSETRVALDVAGLVEAERGRLPLRQTGEYHQHYACLRCAEAEMTGEGCKASGHEPPRMGTLQVPEVYIFAAAGPSLPFQSRPVRITDYTLREPSPVREYNQG